MPLRITNEETEQLIREMAELEQVTPSEAVHKAVHQWMSKLDLTSREGEVVEAIVRRRISIAAMDGQDWESSKIVDDVVSAAVMLIVILIFGFAVPGIRIVVIIVSIVSLYMYHRKVERMTADRSKRREVCLKEIAETRKKLPRELEFLSDGPTFWDPVLSSDDVKVSK